MKGLRLFIVVFMITTFVLHTDRRRAEAIIPLALAPAAPYVLAALVGGTTALWCYTHGGKEAWIEAYGATVDGLEVTSDWIRDKIYQNNGVDPTVSPVVDNFYLDPSGQNWLQYGDQIYKVTSISDWSSAVKKYPPVVETPTIYASNSLGIQSFKLAKVTGPSDLGRVWVISKTIYVAPVVQPVPQADLSEYEHLFEGPALLSNCHAVAKQNPGLVIQYNDWQPEEPETSVPPVYVPPVHIVATLPDGSTVDNEGNVFPPPPGNPWVWPGAISPPAAVPGSVGGVPVELPGQAPSTVALPQPLIDKLRAAGLPENAVITGAGPGHITFKDPTDGKEKYLPIPQDTAAELPKAIAKASASASSEGIELGDMDVPQLPEQPSFASDFDYDEPEDWNWTSWMTNPFTEVIDSMKIETSGATSVISFPVNLGFHQFTVNADFSDYAPQFAAVGNLMVVMAGFMSIMLVVKK